MELRRRPLVNIRPSTLQCVTTVRSCFYRGPTYCLDYSTFMDRTSLSERDVFWFYDIRNFSFGYQSRNLRCGDPSMLWRVLFTMLTNRVGDIKQTLHKLHAQFYSKIILYWLLGFYVKSSNLLSYRCVAIICLLVWSYGLPLESRLNFTTGHNDRSADPLLGPSILVFHAKRMLQKLSHAWWWPFRR